MNRRDFTKQISSVLAAGTVAACNTPAAKDPSAQVQTPAKSSAAPPPDSLGPEHDAAMDHMINKLAPDAASREKVMPKQERRIVMLAYPDMFPLDLVGPHSILSGLLNTKVDIVWKDKLPLTAAGLTFVPSMTLDEVPQDLDVLFVPGGGMGTVALMSDPAILRFLADRGSRAKYVCSVCTGSLVLGAAGLLKGYRATTHWVMHDVLPMVGATSVKERVVVDRNRVTAAGVSAGIDGALVLAGIMTGEPYAKALQLNIEYDPQPPFHAGSPSGAGAEITALMSAMYKPLVQASKAAARKLG